MNEHSQPGFGKISVHGDGMGVPTPELIEKRARELALIEERNPDDFTDADWDQARAELMGIGADTPAELDGAPDIVEEHEFIAGSEGHRAARTGEDDEMLGAQLVAGGVEEATHDQMVEAARSEQKLEGGT